MIKGIFAFIKWLWKGDLFADGERDKHAPVSPAEFASTAAELMKPPIVPTSFEEADAVAENIAQRLEGNKPWLACVGAVEDAKYGHVVRVGIYLDVLQLKPEKFQYLSFTQMVDGVQVRLVPVDRTQSKDK